MILATDVFPTPLLHYQLSLSLLKDGRGTYLGPVMSV